MTIRAHELWTGDRFYLNGREYERMSGLVRGKIAAVEVDGTALVYLAPLDVVVCTRV